MQFGRFHAVALLGLGGLLVLVETVVIFKEKAPPTEVAAPAPGPRVAQPGGTFPGLEYLSGVLGIVFLSAGAYALAQASRKGSEERREEAEREEDRSFGRPGHHVSTPTIWKQR